MKTIISDIVGLPSFKRMVKSLATFGAAVICYFGGVLSTVPNCPDSAITVDTVYVEDAEVSCLSFKAGYDAGVYKTIDWALLLIKASEARDSVTIDSLTNITYRFTRDANENNN